ncbi:MAG: hypothetical protein NWE98_05480 [Candidatus Bathyarchaeota archaeon]|nr:hypothetical protein [Candidatus Bathyarchaeota archaeon]
MFGGNTQEYRLFVYDPQNQTLTQTASMPTYRTRFGVAVVDRKIYTIGGQGAPCHGPTNINEVYDTQTDTWETKQPTIDTGSVMIANAVRGKIYVMTYSNVDVYDPEADTWTRISALPQEVLGPRYSCVMMTKYT